MSLDREKFLKVLALAESSNDAEALGAIRKAASMARRAGKSLGEAIGEMGGRRGAGSPSASMEEMGLLKQALEDLGIAQDEAKELRTQVRRARERIVQLGGDVDDPAFMSDQQVMNRLRDLRAARGASVPWELEFDCLRGFRSGHREYAEQLLRRELDGAADSGGPPQRPRRRALPKQSSNAPPQQPITGTV